MSNKRSNGEGIFFSQVPVVSLPPVPFCECRQNICVKERKRGRKRGGEREIETERERERETEVRDE
jgi:hypothetical protein